MDNISNVFTTSSSDDSEQRSTNISMLKIKKRPLSRKPSGKKSKKSKKFPNNHKESVTVRGIDTILSSHSHQPINIVEYTESAAGVSLKSLEENRQQRALILRTENVDATVFDTNDFIYALEEISTNLLDEDNITTTTKQLSNCVDNFQKFSDFIQERLTDVKERAKEMKERVKEKLNQPAASAGGGGGNNLNLEDAEAIRKVAEINVELAKTMEELTMAAKITTVSKQTAAKAAEVAERARQEALQIEEELKEQENRRILEEKRVEKEKLEAEKVLKEDIEKRRKEERAKEQQRVANLQRSDTKLVEETFSNTFTYYYMEGEGGDKNEKQTEFVACVIRTNQPDFQKDCVAVEILGYDKFKYMRNEELISKVIRVSIQKKNFSLTNSAYISIPHQMTRASAISREPVLKYDTAQKATWWEQKSIEINIDQYKDLKFVQCEMKDVGDFAAVARFKKDYMILTRKGGRAISALDPRLTFSANHDTFLQKEHFTVAIQPVDSHSINEVKVTLEEDGRFLYNTSAIFHVQWESRKLSKPITMSIPINPNPVKARKAAALRAKNKNVNENDEAGGGGGGIDNNNKKSNSAANNDEDENDTLYLLKSTNGDKWVQVETTFTGTKIDVAEFTITEPIPILIVLRMKTRSNAQMAINICNTLSDLLRRRSADVIVRQHEFDHTDMIITIVQSLRTDRVRSTLTNHQYVIGDNPVRIRVSEGDALIARFRGNVVFKNEGSDAHKQLIYNSQLDTTVYVRLAVKDKFLQKTFENYRGVLQLHDMKTLALKATAVVKTGRRDKQAAAAAAAVIDDRPLAEISIDLPKSLETLEVKQSDKIAAKLLKTQDGITEKQLLIIAKSLGDEWRKLIVNHLQVPVGKLEYVMKNHPYDQNSDNEEERDIAIRYELLLLWAKTQPRSVNKAAILQASLGLCGRHDLADKMAMVIKNTQTANIRRSILQHVLHN